MRKNWGNGLASSAIDETHHTGTIQLIDSAPAAIQDRFAHAASHHPTERLDRFGEHIPSRAYAVAKRTIDISFSLAIVSVTLPLFVAVVLLVRLSSPGPAIFRQVRVGKGGRHFTLYKFRTMRHDPTATIVMFRDDDGHVHHKIRNDARVTPIGRLLRRTSIDELPQLINIIKGDMSLIGPRPELAEIVARYEPWQHARHVVRPGLTGWWQVSGRGDLPMEQNTELDLYYIRHQSFSLDLRIALKTIRVVLRGSGAY